MKRLLCALWILTIALLPAARTEARNSEQDAACRENRRGCLLIQTVMTGCFDESDPEDALSDRVLSSTYSLLCSVTEDDVDHFSEEFGEDRDRVLERLYAAMRGCLSARIRLNGAPDGASTTAERVLMLFIDPASQDDATYQAEQIRLEMTDAALERLASEVGAPRAFIEWLIMQ